MFLLLEVFMLVLLLQTVGFVLSVWLERNSIADVFWGLVIALMAIYCVTRLEVGTYQTLLVGVLIAFWGFRLSGHIGRRFIRKKTEDPRYAAMSQGWTKYYLRSYLQVFLLQGVLMVLMLSALMTTIVHPQIFSFTMMGLGFSVWLIGLVFEIVADAQRAKFVKTKKPGQIMQRGLWRYSRHPNYFGEVILWWGIWLITLPSPFWWLSLITPLTITFLILKVSGVPMAEEHYKDNAEFQAYKKRTSIFIPWRPKK